jgi:hypothetical protein
LDDFLETTLKAISCKGVETAVGVDEKEVKPECASGVLEESSFFQNIVGTIFVHGLEGPGGELQFNESIQFGHPDALVTQIGSEGAVDLLDVIEADPALFFGFTAVVDTAAAEGLGPGDHADSGHKAWVFLEIEKAGKGQCL